MQLFVWLLSMSAGTGSEDAGCPSKLQCLESAAEDVSFLSAACDQLYARFRACRALPQVAFLKCRTSQSERFSAGMPSELQQQMVMMQQLQHQQQLLQQQLQQQQQQQQQQQAPAPPAS